MRNTFILATATLLCIAFCSCKKNIDSDNTDAAKSAPANESEVYRYIRQLGYPDTSIRGTKDKYLVEGDIIFDKDALPDPLGSQGGRSTQYGTSNYVGYNLQPNVTVAIDPSVNAFAAQIADALDMWNNIASFRVHFALVPQGGENILFTNADEDPNSWQYFAAGRFPLNGVPGQRVLINIGALSTLTVLQMRTVLAHELGHNIGLRHTDWTGNEPQNTSDIYNGAFINATHILGTATGADVNSVMNRGQTNTFPPDFSNFDILAAQFLYPANPRFPGTVPVFRYSSRQTSHDHFYTTDYNELGDGSNGNFIFEGIGFFAFAGQDAGTAPVYRYYNRRNGKHFYTTNFGELGGGNSTWNYEGVRFYAYANATNGALPVHRYYQSSSGDHFYTLNQNEFINGTIGYAYEGVGFFAY